MPIDYFSPEFYNSLPSSIRKRIARPVVVFPSDPNIILSPADENQPIAQAYANEVLSRYRIPSDSDMEDDDGIDEGLLSEEEGQEGDGQGDDDEDMEQDQDDTSMSREQFVSRMNLATQIS